VEVTPLVVALTGLGVNVAVTFEGKPDTLSVTELLDPVAVTVTFTELFDLRLTVIGEGTEIEKSAAAAFTVSETAAALWLSEPLAPLTVRL